MDPAAILTLIFNGIVVCILAFIIFFICGIVLLVKSAKILEISQKRKYRWFAVFSFLLPFVIPFILVFSYYQFKNITRSNYIGNVTVQEVSSIPSNIKVPILPEAQISNELWNKIIKQSNDIEAAFTPYEDAQSNIYLMEEASGAPGWVCKVWYVNNDNPELVNAETNNVSCTGLYTDNNGNWFLVDTFAGGYKLEGAKASYISNLNFNNPNLNFSDLSYDSNTGTWYATVIDTTNAPSDITHYYKINFGNN